MKGNQDKDISNDNYVGSIKASYKLSTNIKAVEVNE